MKKSIGPRTIIQPNPVLIIGSYDQNGQANILSTILPARVIML